MHSSQGMQSENNSAVDLRMALVAAMMRNGARWIRFILAILKNEADVEDVMQEAVLRVLARNLPFASEDQVRMYLGRAIGNAALELYNHRKRERTRETPIREHTILPDGGDDPYTAINEREEFGRRERMLALLGDGLRQLPTKQYDAVRLTVLESQGMSIRDAGCTSGIPYSTLRHRSRQGLRRLRRYLERSLARTPASL